MEHLPVGAIGLAVRAVELIDQPVLDGNTPKQWAWMLFCCYPPIVLILAMLAVQIITGHSTEHLIYGTGN
jgi:hypothetical protein